MRLSKMCVAAGLALALPLGVLQPPARPAASEPRSGLHVIPFASGSIDPVHDLAPLDPVEPDLVLVQFQRFGISGIVERVERSGARLVQPLAPVSYLVWADAAETQAIRITEGVRFAGVLPAETRISSSVDASTTALRVTFVGRPAAVGLDPAHVSVRDFTSTVGTVAVLPGGVDRAVELARQPHVYSIADAARDIALRDELSNAVVAGLENKAGEPQPRYDEFLEKIGVDGRGVVVSHVDGGVDMNHPELAGRTKACFDYTAGGALCSAGNNDDVIGHGTHTLGIIMGTGSTGLGDADGFAYGQGIAPGAKAVVQNAIGTPTTQDAFANGFRAMYLDAYKEGAIISANSWGPSGTPKGYDGDTREFDSIVRDVDSKKRGDQELALVFSIMNGRGGKSTQGTPDEAKNIIGIGGSGNRQGPGHDDLCTCTAHGPALDGRLLPTLVAPGQKVMSTRATQGTLCGLSGTSGEIPPSPLHAGCTGTSMASPHVSGGYAVFTQWYRKRFESTPSPALVKGAFVNGAVDLSTNGGVDADGAPLTPIPNNQQGWGRFNLANTIRSWQKGVVHLDQDMVLDHSGFRILVGVKAIDPTEPMKATLVWTDALGHGKGGKLPAWVNDLDLQVSAGGTAYLGNVFRGGWSVTGGKPDRMNNVENVYLQKPGSARFNVEVTAANIIGDGLPNHGDKTDQDFALIITNARSVMPNIPRPR